MSAHRLPRFTLGAGLARGASRALAVPATGAPPGQAEVVVIGGGIIGCAIALFLARRGMPVVLCDKGSIGGEASGRAFGQVASAGLSPVKLELIAEAKRLWAGMDALCGADTGYRRSGYAMWLADAAQEAELSAWLADARTHEPDARLVSARELARLVPLLPGAAAAYLNPSDGTAEPTLAAAAMAIGAARAGARIAVPCAVRSLEMSGGRVVGVVTESGRIRANTVVLAGGCWSSLFAGNAGIELPMLDVHAYCETVAGVDLGPLGSLDGPGVSWRRQADGNYTFCTIGGKLPLTPQVFRYAGRYVGLMRTVHWDLEVSLGSCLLHAMRAPARWNPEEVSPFERRRILEPKTSRRHIELARRKIVAFQPEFARMKPLETWAGALCAPPDNCPTIGPVASHPGLVLATGFSYGLTMAPAVGKAIADLVGGQRPSIDLVPYRYERYIDGTVLQAHA